MRFWAKRSFALLAVLVFLAYESRHHFNQELIQAKRQHNSSQKNWNVFYGQRFVYYDGIFRYQADLDQIQKLIKPGHIVLSDLASSYYVAASLPLYVKNVHRHHGRSHSVDWKPLLDQGLACNLHKDETLKEFKDFVYKGRAIAFDKGQPVFEYILINRDLNNRNVRQDCLWSRRELFIKNIVQVSALIYEGDYFDLYQVIDPLSTTSSKRN